MKLLQKLWGLVFALAVISGVLLVFIPITSAVTIAILVMAVTLWINY